MPITAEERQRRLILSQLLVDILRPTQGNLGSTGNQRLVAYCVAMSTFGPFRLGLNKIGECTGLPRSTTRSTLTELCRKGWIKKLPDKTYVIDEHLIEEAAVTWDLDAKYRLLLDAAREMAKLMTA